MRVNTSMPAVLVVAVLVAGTGFVSAQQNPMSIERAEELGIDRQPVAGANPASAPGVGAGAAGATDFLLIPESTNDRVMAFDPMTGDLINADFIPADPDHLSTPICAILGPNKDTILVSDQIEDVVQEYGLDGSYIGYFAPATGPNTTILNNLRGIAWHSNGHLLVTVASGDNDDAIAEFDTTGTYVGNFIANGAGGLNGPFDVYLRTADVLVPASSSNAVHQYDLTGSYVGNIVASVTFPEQIAEASNGNLLVGGFSAPSGVHEYQADGTFVATYDVITGCRGVFELGNGNILVTNGDGVYEINRSNTVVDTKITGVSARFIELISGSVPIELQSIDVE